ncbi:MAG TPA: phosphotransferase [Candidatus Acidoferrales bacterium]|nr:phosphotransferase [Candidatus Acidoferrales bacterium]
MLTRGLSSALVFRIVVGGSPFLLRIITRTDAVNEPTRQFSCMRAAAEIGLAPRVWYTSIDDRISITDFVEAVPFPAMEAIVRMPTVLQRLHALPPFPKVMNYATLDGFIRRFQAANILPKGETDELFARYAQLAAVYPRHDADMVSSHSDLKPENILFDGHRVWLVDWEAAFLNDRYFDLAVVANFVVTSDAEERAYLREYFGQPPDEYQLARFFLMRQVLHMFYAAIFLLLGSSGKPVNRSEDAPAFEDFHRRIWAGEVDLGDNDMKIAYGRVHWDQLCRNMRWARFDEALKMVSDRHASPKGVQQLLLVTQ